MSDIVERLREVPYGWSALGREAAAEIERLRADKLHWEHQNGILEAEIERLRAALTEIAKLPLYTGQPSDVAGGMARRALEGK